MAARTLQDTPGWTGSLGGTAQCVWVSGSEDEGHGSAKGLPKDHRQEARAPPRNLKANWVQGIPSSERGTGCPGPKGWHGPWAASSTCPRNVHTEPHWLGTLERRETGAVLASMELCLPSQALGLALGTRPAERREETPIYPRKDGGWEVPPPSSSFPQEGSPTPMPSVTAPLERDGGLATAEGPWPFKRSDSALRVCAPQTKWL